MQTLYFLVTTIARIAQGLAITTMELTVLGFIICTFATTVCWWHKPNDVEFGHTLELQKSVEVILKEAGEEATGKYRDTPMDFVSYKPWAGSVIFPYYINLLRRTRLFPNVHKARPIQRLSTLAMRKPLSRSSELVVVVLGIAYNAIFFGAWHFHFPTRIERLLWHIFSAAQMGTSVAIGVLELTRLTWPNPPSNPPGSAGSTSSVDPEKADNSHIKGSFRSFRDFWNKPCNNAIGKHESLNVPLRALVLAMPVCAAYCVCRCYLLLEDLIGLRSVPLTAYRTVNWTQYWPSW